MSENTHPYRDRRTNPFCKCGKHLGLIYHHDHEHEDAVKNLAALQRKFNADQQPESD